MDKARKLKQLILIITMPLVMWLFFNQVAFWHYHVLDNGIVVEHAHPFKNKPIPGTPYQSHQHSDFEYSLLAQISNMISLLLFAMVLGLFLHNISRYYREGYQSFIPDPGHYLIHRLRGPPIVI